MAETASTGLDAPAAAPSDLDSVPFETLLEQLAGRAGEMLVSRQRLHVLMRASMEIVGEPSLPLVLQHAVVSARELVGARYGALALVDAEGLLDQYVHGGSDTGTVSAVTDFPVGHALMAPVVDDPRPIRLSEATDDARSFGFPAHYPPMKGFLGLPIRVGDVVVGNLYLGQCESGVFTAEDEELATAFAATAGTAIERSRLHDQAQTGQRWQLASAEISAMLLAPDSGSDPLQVIIEKVSELADADLATLVLPARHPRTFEVVVATGRGGDRLRGMRSSEENSMARQAMDTGRGSRREAADDDQRFEGHLRRVAHVGPLMAVPLAGPGGTQGAIVVGRLAGRPPFTAADLDLAEAFAIHAAIARELASARTDQQRLALLTDRSRTARDLHDQVLQSLFAAGLTVQSISKTDGAPDLSDRLDDIILNIDETIRQLRASIVQLEKAEAFPSGLRALVTEIVEQITPALGFSPELQFRGPVDTVVAAAVTDAVTAVVREAVTNAARHAEATVLEVTVSVDGQQVSVDVSDDGVGLGPNEDPRRSGLNNLKRRADIWGGTLVMSANEPHGTRLRWTIPIPE